MAMVRELNIIANRTMITVALRAIAPRKPTVIFSSFFFHNTQWLGRTSIEKHQTCPPVDAYKKLDKWIPTKVYLELSKSRLTALNVLTAMSGVALSPLPTTVPILLSTAVGTALCSASANSLNQLQEVPFDAQMARTRNRPLCRRAISPANAAAFATMTGIAGPALLWMAVNPTTAILGTGNIALYAGAYTWMKRHSIWNTWLGAIVGAVPPLMGWTACGGKLWPTVDYPVHLFLPNFISSDLPALDPSFIDNPLAPFALFMLLFSWQFPHFNSLSYVVRGSYAQAGYRMLSILDPAKNALVSLRHAVLLVPICSILVPLSGLATWAFALTALPPNLIILQATWKWWRFGGEKQARRVFQHSLWYLPVMMGLMMFHKQGMDWSKWLLWEEEKDEA